MLLLVDDVCAKFISHCFKFLLSRCNVFENCLLYMFVSCIKVGMDYGQCTVQSLFVRDKYLTKSMQLHCNIYSLLQLRNSETSLSQGVP